MVAEIPADPMFECGICGSEYDTEDEAEECEDNCNLIDEYSNDGDDYYSEGDD